MLPLVVPQIAEIGENKFHPVIMVYLNKTATIKSVTITLFLVMNYLQTVNTIKLKRIKDNDLIMVSVHFKDFSN